MHRLWAYSCLVTKSPPDSFSGCITPGKLKVNTFIKLGLQPRVQVNDKQISGAIDKALNVDDRMLRDSAFIKVYWYKNYKVSAKRLFEADRIKSRGVMEGKLKTSHPTTCAMIGSQGTEIMQVIPLTSHSLKTKFEGHPRFLIGKRLSIKEATDFVDQGNEFHEAEIFSNKSVKAYIEDPFAKCNYDPPREALSCASDKGAE